MNIVISQDEAVLAVEALNAKAADLRNRYERHLALYQETGLEANREAAQDLSNQYQTNANAARAIRQALK